MAHKASAAFAALLAAVGLSAALAGAVVPGPTTCDSASKTVKFESVDTLRDTISARSGPAGAVIVKASGASEVDGYNREDTCPAPPGGRWELVVLSGDHGGDTIDVGAVPKGVKARLNGGGTVDSLEGHAGVDELRGGSSHDTLKAFEGDDLLVGGESTDKLLAGRGDDTIRVRDGGRQADRASCGAGHDIAIADRADELKGCETVR